MRRLSIILPILAALPACGPVNRSNETVHIPVITRSTLTYDIAVTGNALSAEQALALNDYLVAMHVRYGDRIQLDDPYAYGAAERRNAVASVIGRYGLTLEPSSATGVTPGTIRLTILRAKAEVPGCPNWERPSQPELAASTASNFGCAMQSNIAAMVADPNDLLEGKSTDAPDMDSAVRAVRTYRTVKTTYERNLNSVAAATTTNGGGNQ